MMRVTIALLLMLASAVSPAAQMQIEGFTARFVLTVFGTTIGRSEWRLVPIENGRFLWEARSETAGAGALIRDVYITERSESEAYGEAFRPRVYSYDRYGKNATRSVRVTFDWNNGVALNTANGQTWRMSVPPETLDKFNYLLALMRDLADGQRSMQYTIADGGRLKVYDMREIGSETLETALGTLETVKIRRLRHQDDREAILWSAPALGYLPVKLAYRDGDGRLISMTIQSIEGRPPTVVKNPGG